MSTFGPAYNHDLDSDRLQRQHVSIRRLMSDGNWRTLQEIAHALGFPEASISAQLRHLRKPEFGGFTVEKQRRSGALWEYRVVMDQWHWDGTQADFFTQPERRPMDGH